MNQKLLIELDETLGQLLEGDVPKDKIFALKQKVSGHIVKENTYEKRKDKSWWYRYRDDCIIERVLRKEDLQDISLIDGVSVSYIRKLVRDRLPGTWIATRLEKRIN